MRVIREILFATRPQKMFGRMRAGISETDATFEEKRGMVVIRGKAPGDRRFYEVPDGAVVKVCEDVEASE